MPLEVLTRDNIPRVSRETGYSEEELMKLLLSQAVLGKPAYVKTPLPKHLR